MNSAKHCVCLVAPLQIRYDDDVETGDEEEAKRWNRRFSGDNSSERNQQQNLDTEVATTNVDKVINHPPRQVRSGLIAITMFVRLSVSLSVTHI